MKRNEIVVHSLEGDREPRIWVDHSEVVMPGDWSPDGTALVYTKRDAQNSHIAMNSEEGEETILLDGPFRERAPRLSPDGRWLAYESNENGRMEIFVRAFPSMERKQRVSTAGGVEPVWSPDGTALYYREGDTLMSTLMTVSGNDIVVGPTQSHFTIAAIDPGPFRGSYDIAPDGERFLFIVPTDTSPPEIRVVLNGVEELAPERP